MDRFSSESLLDKREFVRQVISPTTWGKRLANYIIDFILSYIIAVIVIIIIGVVWGALIDEDIISKIDDMNSLVDRLITFLFQIICYYIPLEYFAGKTIGKMITRTKVVTEEGEKPDFGTIVGRSCVRIISFEVFSFLSETPIGWHDKVSGTMVVDDIPLYNLDSFESKATSFYEEEKY
ncbi:RDD family protein [Xanthocytophaga agilis]|uniref:RDD family protein n=1 Tax=Xanthocytophaga agilis TaxID=3048010 RepID=A0AAE3UE67_9BACT|nr:RDD family protein [Xanthocytophaga agilis]MDJ1502588.1 RDD family protein [Xanthocytophaga agilis]